MIAFKTGVHTIEFQTTNQLNLSRLPAEYREAIKPETCRRYRLNVTKLPSMPEYSNPSDTQAAIETAFAVCADVGAGYPKITRIDYRFDDHDGKYADHLRLMMVLVNLIAYESGIYDRRVFYADGNGTITSVRCMPHDNDHGTRYGIEYYDKLSEMKSAKYGNARLELRRLNMEGESVQFILREWRDMLQLITRAKYLEMLKAHAYALCSIKQDSETTTEFVRRTRGKLIAYEEWNIIHKMIGKHTNHYDKAAHLPKWAEVKALIDGLTAQLDEAISQPLTDSFHLESVKKEMPF